MDVCLNQYTDRGLIDTETFCERIEKSELSRLPKIVELGSSSI